MAEWIRFVLFATCALHDRYKMPFEPGVRGYLLIRVEEASGKTQKDLFTWDTSSSAFEAFVKGEKQRCPPSAACGPSSVLT